MNDTMSPCLIEDNAGYLHLCNLSETDGLIFPAINLAHTAEEIANLIASHESIEWDETDPISVAHASALGDVVWGEAQGWCIPPGGGYAREVAIAAGIELD